MGETNITINFDAAKLDALEFALRKQRSSVQRRWRKCSSSSTSRKSRKRCESMWTVRRCLPQGPSDRYGQQRQQMSRQRLCSRRNNHGTA